MILHLVFDDSGGIYPEGKKTLNYLGTIVKKGGGWPVVADGKKAEVRQETSNRRNELVLLDFFRVPFFKPRRKRFISKPRDGIIFSIHEWDEYSIVC